MAGLCNLLILRNWNFAPLEQQLPGSPLPLPLTTTILLTVSMGLAIFRNLVYVKPRSVCPSVTGLNQGLKEISASSCSLQRYSQQPRHGNNRHVRGQVNGHRRALTCSRILFSHEREGSHDSPGGHHWCVQCQEIWATVNDGMLVDNFIHLLFRIILSSLCWLFFAFVSYRKCSWFLFPF